MAKKEKEVTALSIGTPAPMEALEILREELNTLKTITETSYQTQGKVDGFGTNIQNETSIETLIKMQSSITGRAEGYARAATDLGLKSFPVFKINGFTADAYTSDIKLRIDVINHSDRKKELEEALKEAEGFMTKEDQWKLFCKKLEKIAGK